MSNPYNAHNYGPAQPFADWLAVQPSKTHRVTPRTTVHQYSSYVRRVLTECHDLTPSGVLGYVNGAANGGSNESFNNFVKAVKRYDRFVAEVADEKGLPAPIPLAKKLVQQYSQNDEESHADGLTRDEVDTLVRVAREQDDPEFALLVEVAWDLLARVGDMEGQTWAQVTFKTIKVAGFEIGAVVDGIGKKTGAGGRGYVWTEGLAQRLKDIRQSRKAKDSEYIFHGGGERGDLRRDTINKRLKLYAELAGIAKDRIAEEREEVHAHLLRGGAATFLAMKGVPIPAIKLMGRWKSLQALQRYLKLGDEEVAKALGQAFAPKVTVAETEPANVKSVGPMENPTAILRVRLARGEITVAEYRELMALVVTQ